MSPDRLGLDSVHGAARTSLSNPGVFAEITVTCHHLHVEVDPAGTTLLAIG